MQKYEQNKPLDKEQFAITIGGKAYTDKKEAELGEKLDRLTALNALLNMDEKGNDAIGMDEETQEAEPALLKEKLPEMKASVSGTPAGGMQWIRQEERMR